MLSKLPLTNENHVRLFALFAEAASMHATAATDLPFKGQLTWGFFRMGADTITAPANSNAADPKKQVARAFADNRNEMLYGVTVTKPPVFIPPAVSVSGSGIMLDYAATARDVSDALPLPAPVFAKLESSDSFDSTKVISFEKYKRDLVRAPL
jgi:hypothetical protein